MKPLLLLHGAMGAQDSFDPLVPLLSPYFDLYRFNFSGHGDRPFSPSFGITTFTEEIIRFMNDHGIREADIFGYDMGGYIGLNLLRLYPARTGKLFTLGTRFFWDPESAGKAIRQLKKALSEQKMPALASGEDSGPSPAHMEELLERTSKCLEALGENNILNPQVVGQIPHQVVVALGDSDEMISIEETETAVQTLPNGKLVVLENATHNFDSVDQDALAEEMLDFF